MKGIHALTTLATGTVLLALVVACAGTTEGTEQQLGAATGLSNDLAQLQSELDNVSGQLNGLQTRLETTEEGINSFTATAGVHSLSRTADVPDPPGGKVAVRLSFDYLPDALAGEGIQPHTVLPEVSTVWAMESLAKGQPVPVGEVIKDNTVFLAPGESQMVTLVYQNPTSENVGFMGMPHQESPGNLHTQTWLTCFCLAFIYEAPAEGAWYRVIQVGVSPDMPAGSKVDALWTILTDPSVFPTE